MNKILDEETIIDGPFLLRFGEAMQEPKPENEDDQPKPKPIKGTRMTLTQRETTDDE